MRRAAKITIGTIALVLAAGVALGACMPSSEPKGDVGSGPADGPAIEIIAVDDKFTPDDLSFDTGDEITVEVANEGDSAHEFTIEELDLSTGTISPGKVAHATFVVPDGTTQFVCTYHSGMRGEVVGRKA
jgi:plastocyanin